MSVAPEIAAENGIGLPPLPSPTAAKPPEVSTPIPAASGGDLSPAQDANNVLAVVARLAVDPRVDISVLKELLAVRRQEEDRLAERAFNEAMSLAKGELQPVLKTNQVDFQSRREGAARTKYRYESFADVARVVDPVFSKHGLSYRFETAQSGDLARVTCVVAHRDGHATRTSLEGRPDPGNTGMNPVQAIGSLLTYLQRYSLRSAIGLAAGVDDDGRGGSPPIEAAEIRELEDLIASTASSEVTMLRLIGVGSIAEMTQEQFIRMKEVLSLRKAERSRRQGAAP